MGDINNMNINDKRTRYNELKKMEQAGSLGEADREELAMLRPQFENL